MKGFLLGFLTAVVAVLVAGFVFIHNGLLDPRADVPVNSVEQKIAMPALDASVDRRAPGVKNPLEPTEANLTAGMKVYQSNCSSCHGDIHRPHGMFADALYPRAPQFVEDAPDMPEYENFFIIAHGIRLSGMPAWKQSLSELQMWQVTTFLSHINKLPPPVSELWKTAAGGPAPRPASDQDMRMK